MAALMATMKQQLSVSSEQPKQSVMATARFSPLLTLLRLRAGYRRERAVMARAERINLVSSKS